MILAALLGLLVALVTGTALHEAGHYAALRACGRRPRRWHLGVGPVLVRRGRWVVHAWPVGVGMDTGRAGVYRWGPWRRLFNHLAGPAANAATALLCLAFWLVRPAEWLLWLAIGQVLLAATNLLPLPFADGGWVVTALANAAIHRGRMRLPTETRWHLAAMPYGLAGAVVGLGATVWFGLAR